MAHIPFTLGAPAEPIPIGDEEDETQITQHNAQDHDLQGNDWLSAELRDQVAGDWLSQVPSQVQATAQVSFHVLQDGPDERADQDSGPRGGRLPSIALSSVSQVVPIDLTANDTPRPLHDRDQTPVRRTGQAGSDNRRPSIPRWSSPKIFPKLPPPPRGLTLSQTSKMVEVGCRSSRDPPGVSSWESPRAPPPGTSPGGALLLLPYRRARRGRL